MRPYGIPRIKDAEFPDVADIQRFGFKSSAGRIKKETGEYHGYSRTRPKAKVRRYWARRARTQAKEEIRKEHEE